MSLYRRIRCNEIKRVTMPAATISSVFFISFSLTQRIAFYPLAVNNTAHRGAWGRELFRRTAGRRIKRRWTRTAPMCVTLWSWNGNSASSLESPNGANGRQPGRIRHGCLTGGMPRVSPQCDFLLGRHGSAATPASGAEREQLKTDLSMAHAGPAWEGGSCPR